MRETPIIIGNSRLLESIHYSKKLKGLEGDDRDTIGGEPWCELVHKATRDECL